MKHQDSHSRVNANRMNDAFAFLVEACLSAVTHDCDCPNCTMQKGRAVKSLVYLCGEKMGIEEAVSLLGGTGADWAFDVGGQTADDADFDPIPDEVIEVCRESLHSKLSQDKKAIIAGWLESVGA